MEIQYRRNFNESYMVIEAQAGKNPYEEQMLRQNEISSLLAFHSMEMNHSVQFWYNITGREALREVLEKEGVSAALMRKIVEALAAACDEIQRYLLKQDHIYLDPDTVFVDRSQGGFRLMLCYYPAETEDLFGQFRSMLEFILTFLGEDEEKTTELCCGLYEIALRENYTFEQLLMYLDEAEGAGPSEEREKTENSAEVFPETDLAQYAVSEREKPDVPMAEDAAAGAEPYPEELPLFDEGELAVSEGMFAGRGEPGWKNMLRQWSRRAKEEVQELREVAGMLIAGKNISDTEKDLSPGEAEACIRSEHRPGDAKDRRGRGRD